MLTEANVVALLARRYTRVSMGAHRYAFAAHVPDRPFGAYRVADFIAQDTWQSTHYALHGHEIKTSRADWLRELRDPDKCATWRDVCDHWWLVIAHPSIIAGRAEVPPEWGILVAQGSRLVVSRTAPATSKQPLNPAMTAALLRATAKTARAQAATP